ncbi:MAG: glycosyltransferase [archaeon]
MPSKKRTLYDSASVIIPAFNAEKILPACLDALFQQTVLPSEVIVVDDGSVDGTREVAGAYSMVTVLAQKNMGPAVARNNGARVAKSDIVVFLDSDCVPEVDWVEKMLEPFADENIVGVQGAYRSNQKEWVAQFEQMDIEYRYEKMKRSPKLDWIGSYSAAYRKKVFLSEGGFDESFPKASGEDAELSYRLAAKGMKLIFQPAAIVFHTHPGTLSHYLKVKFFRAYWRTRMYLKHPEKSVKDSYTPHMLKINFFVGGAFLLVLFFLLANLLINGFSKKFLIEEVAILFSVVFILGLFIIATLSEFLFSVFQKKPFLLPGAIVVVFLRSIVFVFGAGFGLVDVRVWK